jgi:3-hydroxyacyl-CoA dehydrogenase
MNINKVAVIGAGVMGASIAAHIANAGLPVLLLDIVPKDAVNRNQITETAVGHLLKSEPPALMHAKAAKLITAGNIEDHLPLLKDVDWVIEAIIENPEIKQALYAKLELACRADTIISSNTSTLPLALLCQGRSETFSQQFLITHFFNPPRYMRLLEIVTSPATNKDVVKSISQFADIHLGKGCVLCHDTPGFIANRIGTFWLQAGLLQAIANHIPIAQADAIMTAFGIPKTGIFGLLDLIGLDLVPHILKSFKQLLPDNDAFQAINHTPDLVQRMIADGYTGRKGKGGFYRLQKRDDGKRIKEAIDLNTGEYQVAEKIKPDKNLNLTALLSNNDAASQFAWQVMSETLLYSASLIPEIADDIVSVDNAMRLGYNWKYGPFELMDLVGVDWFVKRLKQEHKTIPALLAARQPLYQTLANKPCYRDLGGQYVPVPRAEGLLVLADIKSARPPVLSNASASLWDIGDGVACLEFHSKMNTLDNDSLELLRQSISKVKTSFVALVIYNDAENFSAGANLTLLMQAIHQQNWAAVEHLIQQGQQTYHALKYSPFPVVGAPSGLALGGGCEVLLHCDAIVGHAELYMGLVEVGVGLVPGWGGCKEYLHRQLGNKKRPGGAMPALAQAFENIGTAKVSKSAADAKELLYLSNADSITMNKDRLLADAKAKVLSLVPNYQAPEPATFHLPGASAKAAMLMAVNNLYLSGKISDYDVEISSQLAQVLSGGTCDITDVLTEQDILNLELQAFVNLVKQSGTLFRLERLLKAG